MSVKEKMQYQEKILNAKKSQKKNEIKSRIKMTSLPRFIKKSFPQQIM